jgi:uncharacterized protein
MPQFVRALRARLQTCVRRARRRVLRTDMSAALASSAVAGLVVLGSGAAADRVRPIAAPATLDAQSADLVARRVSAAHSDITAVWRHDFRWRLGRDYVPPELVHFSGRRPSPCAGPKGLTGLAYCPLDRTLSVDLTFLAALAGRVRGESDRTLLLLVARVEADHVQAELKILSDVERLARDLPPDDRARLAQMVTLQGDCLAGVWAQRARRKIGPIAPGSWGRVVDAVRGTSADAAASARLHEGSLAEREVAFAAGYEAGQIRDCLEPGLEGVLG